MIHPLDVRMCNCARCDRELLGRSMAGMALPYTCDGMAFVGGRINQRPYCPECLRVMHSETCDCLNHRSSGNVATRRGRFPEDDDPAEQYAVRVLEDDPGEV